MGIGLTLLMVVAIVTRAAATPDALGLFKKLYVPKDGTALASANCLVCHSQMPPSKTALNPYGKDLQKAAKGGPIDEKAFRAIEKLSSAGDGVNNIDKIKAGQLPGSPKPK
jgi:hypothetical protein